MAKKQSTPVTKSSKVVAPITFDDLAETLQRFQTHKKVPKSVKIAPDVADYINKYFAPAKNFEADTMYGIKVIVDDTLPDGAWRVVEK